MKNFKMLASKFVLGFLLIGGILFSTGLSSATAGGQGLAYKVVAKADNPVIAPGQSTILWVTIQNTGIETWNSDRNVTCYYDGNSNLTDCGAPDSPIRLGTTRPIDRVSIFATDGNWISKNRVHQADEYSAGTGDNMSFGFYITAPSNIAAGHYTECFAPVVENEAWLTDQDLCWDINVVGEANPYQTKFYPEKMDSDNTQYLTLAPGEQQEVSIAFQNMGTATWYNHGANPVHLATIGDYGSYIEGDNWLTNNRPANLVEDTVLPGQIGHFVFNVKPQDVATVGTYALDRFWLVAENKKWFDIPFDGSSSVPQIDILIVNSSANKQVTADMLNALADVKALTYTSNTQSIFNDYDYGYHQPVNFNLNGAYDISNEDKPINMMDFYLNNFDESFSENNTFSVNYQTDSIDSFIKYNIEGLDQDLYAGLSEFNNVWIKIDQKQIEEILNKYDLNYADLIGDNANNDLQINPMQALQIADIINQSRIFTLVDEYESEEINGHECRHFAYQLDMNMLEKNMWQISQIINPDYNYGVEEIESNSITEQKMIYGDILIGESDNLPYRISVDNISSTDGQLYKSEILLDDYNQKIDYKEPTSFQLLSDVFDRFEKIVNQGMGKLESINW
jgi:hypothetical protein